MPLHINLGLITIDDNVPLPPHPRVGRTKYPVEALDAPGKSFLVKCPMNERSKLQAGLYAATKIVQRTHPERKFWTRRVEDGVRIWRVA